MESFEEQQKHFRWRLHASVLAGLQRMFFAYYDNGGTIETIAETLDRPASWVNARLKGKTKLTLNAISDLALAMEGEIRFQVREFAPTPQPKEQSE